MTSPLQNADFRVTTSTATMTRHFFSGDDALHFKSGQLEADDEHAQRKIKKYPVRSLPRI